MIRVPGIGVLLLLAGACGSVQLPQERYWRLELPAPVGGELPRGGVLRVHDLQLGNALQGDCLLVAPGDAQLVPRLTDHWIAPLERLVTDAVVLGLSRTRMFALVKGAGDAGGEDCELHGRIIDFAEHREGAATVGRAVFDFWVECRGELRFHDEFTAAVALRGEGAGAAVMALSAALLQVLDQLAGRMRAAGLFDRTVDSAPAK